MNLSKFEIFHEAILYGLAGFGQGFSTAAECVSPKGAPLSPEWSWEVQPETRIRRASKRPKVAFFIVDFLPVGLKRHLPKMIRSLFGKRVSC